LFKSWLQFFKSSLLPFISDDRSRLFQLTDKTAKTTLFLDKTTYEYYDTWNSIVSLPLPRLQNQRNLKVPVSYPSFVNKDAIGINSRTILSNNLEWRKGGMEAEDALSG
jgi:hypothetical protein